MPKGEPRTLLAHVLAGSFRAERHGPLFLDEQSPEELPVEANEQARAAWADLVVAQAEAREAGFVNAWAVVPLVRRLHEALASSEVSPWSRMMLLTALGFGPWRLTSTTTGEPVGEMGFTDEELRVAWVT
jgi:hypothetical protein